MLMVYNNAQMKRKQLNESGFIPLLLTILALVLLVIYFAYTRVLNASH